jgi:hypothetical protein
MGAGESGRADFIRMPPFVCHRSSAAGVLQLDSFGGAE